MCVCVCARSLSIARAHSLNASLVHSTRPYAKGLEAHEVKTITLFQPHTVAGKNLSKIFLSQAENLLPLSLALWGPWSRLLAADKSRTHSTIISGGL